MDRPQRGAASRLASRRESVLRAREERDGWIASLVDNNGFSISWTPCTDGDVIGYKVYLYDPSPLREDSYRVVEEDLIVTSNQYVYNGEFCGLCWVRVSTVNGGLLESPLSPPAVVERNVPPQPSIQDPTVDASPSVPQPGPGSGPSPYEMYPTK